MLFRVLGPLEIEGSAELTSGNLERLLALLLQRPNAWVDADAIVAALWPEDPPPSAKGNVKAQVHQLRQLLPRALDGSPRINTRSGGYRLNLERTELDAVLFEDLIRQGQSALAAGAATMAISRLAQALELWRGEPFGPLGRELALPEADRLRALRDEALDNYQRAREAQKEAQEKGLTEPEPESDDDEEAAERTVVLRLGPPPDVRPPPDKDLQPWSQWRVQGRDKPRRRRLRAVVATVTAAVLVAAGVVVAAAALGARRDGPVPGEAAPVTTTSASSSSQPPASDSRPAGAQPGVAPRRPVPGLPPPGARALLFGIGDRADTARGSVLVRDTPVRMLTTWYRGHDDLPALVAWKDTVIAQAYADGFALHLVIAATEAPARVATPHGPACGRPSVLRPAYLDDITGLAKAFAGTAKSPPLFVTVFDQVQTYACNPAGFQPDRATAAYYRTLKDQYVLIRERFHRSAPNALVSLGWGAGLARTQDNPETAAGLSMLRQFNEVLTWSDFHSVSVSEGRGDNAADVAAMVGALGAYGPVMLGSYAPAGSRASVVDADLRTLLDGDRLEGLTRKGLFALSLAPGVLTAAEPRTNRFVSQAIRDYGRPPN